MEYYPAIGSSCGTKQQVYGEHMEVPHDTTISAHTISYYHFRMKHPCLKRIRFKQSGCVPLHRFFLASKLIASISQTFPTWQPCHELGNPLSENVQCPFFNVKGWRDVGGNCLVLMVAQCSSRFSHVYWWSRGTDAVSWAQSVEPRWTAPTTAPREMASEHHVAASGDGGGFSP